VIKVTKFDSDDISLLNQPVSVYRLCWQPYWILQKASISRFQHCRMLFIILHSVLSLPKCVIFKRASVTSFLTIVSLKSGWSLAINMETFHTFLKIVTHLKQRILCYFNTLYIHQTPCSHAGTAWKYGRLDVKLPIFIF
jgi:hypothetical protein